MKLAFVQLLLVAHATSIPANAWVGEFISKSYHASAPMGDAPSEPNACQEEGFLRSSKYVQTSSFRLDDTWYCGSSQVWKTTSDLDPYNLAGMPVDPDDRTFHFPIGDYAIGDAVPIEETTAYEKYHWSCTADGRMRRNAYECTDSMCTDCNDIPNGVVYDAGTSVTDFGPTTGEDFSPGPENGVCLGMELDNPPGADWAKWHFMVAGYTTTSGDASVSFPALPSCDGNHGGGAPPSGLHLSADDAKIIFGPNGECEIHIVPGESKLVSTCEIVVQSA